ncbi:type VII secretion protein EccB [Frankia sp. QA3]|uniref:type VII secretion protein EccB n=1 Tax=Frankia sp. QA3 TaxID=710111 RepID=UPI000269BBFA|nr:type VII secretion protein EccB [Frankia sp. QA3]EIV92649.1 type VII secretion protein EccB, Actinobacterial [Frankia sp. QA3]
MATRRDQLHSHQFQVQRVVSALVMRERDPADPPLRRGRGAVLAAVMVAILIAVGSFGYGIWKGSENAALRGNEILLERETGALFVYRDGVLSPVPNYASARLLLGAGAPLRALSRETLAVVVSADTRQPPRRGPSLGIAGAPGSLPPAREVAGGPWTICATTPTTERPSVSILQIGQARSEPALSADAALLVRDRTQGTVYLVAGGHRFPIVNSVVRDLFPRASPVTVDHAWIEGLTEGERIPPVVDYFGVRFPGTDRSVGDLLSTQGQYQILLENGAYPLGRLQLAAYREYLAKGGHHIGEENDVPNISGRFGRSSYAAGLARAPDGIPSVVPAGKGVCAEYGGPDDPPTIRVAADLPADLGVATGTGGTSGVDRVAFTAGGIAVVASDGAAPASGMPTPSTPEPSNASEFTLVTEAGTRFRVPSVQDLERLGYPPKRSVRVPGSLLALLPEGPVLSADDAARAHDTAGTDRARAGLPPSRGS